MTRAAQRHTVSAFSNLIGKETQPVPLTTSLGCLRRQGEAEKLRFRLISYFGRHRAGLDGPFETIG